jgi:transposase-like protein
MSHKDDTLRQRLRQYLDNIEEVKEGKEWPRDLVEWLVQELPDVEFSEFMAAGPYERSEDRQSYRNGYRQRDLFTRVGQLILRVPRDREGRFSTQLFERYHRGDKALVLALQESNCKALRPEKCVASPRNYAVSKSVKRSSLSLPRGFPYGSSAG